MIQAMDSSVLWRSALIQTAGVAVLSAALGPAVPSSYFERCGRLAWRGREDLAWT